MQDETPASVGTDRTSSTDETDFIVSPFKILVDSREKAPWHFRGLHANASDGGEPILVRTEYAYLQTGDYTIEGCKSRVAVERKSKADAYGSFGNWRARFEKELERLDAMDFAAVIIECDWRELMLAPPNFSKLQPMTIHRSVIAWEQRYPTIHWWIVPGRRFAEKTCYRILERWWKEHSE